MSENHKKNAYRFAKWGRDFVKEFNRFYKHDVITLDAGILGEAMFNARKGIRQQSFFSPIFIEKLGRKNVFAAHYVFWIAKSRPIQLVGGNKHDPNLLKINATFAMRIMENFLKISIENRGQDWLTLRYLLYESNVQPEVLTLFASMMGKGAFKEDS